VHSINGLAFIDVRLIDGESGDLIPLLQEAVGYLRQTEQWDVVHEEIAFVAATRHPRGNISVRMRSYMSPFVGYEAESSFLLACKLVWAAWYIRLRREVEQTSVSRDEAAIRARCDEQQLQFVNAVPGSDEWRDYIMEQR
jgi:hypothetical protein